MAIQLTTPGGPIVIGPGAILDAGSDLLALDNPPYTWTFSFAGPDLGLPAWSQQVVTSSEFDHAQIRLLWQDTTTPSTLLQNTHLKENDNVRINVQVRNQAGEQIDVLTPELNVQWQPTVWAHLESALWANNIVSRLSTGSGSDQLDRIESAVYQVFPHA